MYVYYIYNIDIHMYVVQCMYIYIYEKGVWLGSLILFPYKLPNNCLSGYISRSDTNGSTIAAVLMLL